VEGALEFYAKLGRAILDAINDKALERLGNATEAFAAAQLERGFRTLDFYKSLQPVPPL
jgi:hypothetical protein